MAVDFRRRGMTAIPCTPYCPGRSAECHGTCEAYKAYRAEMDAQCEARKTNLQSIYISRQKEQCRRKMALEKNAGRR